MSSAIDVAVDALERLEDCGVVDVASVDAEALTRACDARTGDVTAAGARALTICGRACADALERGGFGRKRAVRCREVFDRAKRGEVSARDACVDALRRCATTLQLEAVETATREREGTVRGGAVGDGGAPADAMEVDETSERATRALERLRAGWSGEDGTSAAEALRAATTRAEALLKELPENHTHKVLNAASWTSEQHEMIEEVEKALHAEYKARREMVVNRAQVTTTSFCYSPRLHALKEVREEFARKVVTDLHVTSEVTMDDVCDARYADLAMAGIKVNAGSEGLQSAVKKVIMGAVPDRGGRTDGGDRAAMPAFAARAEGPSSGRGRGGGGGRGSRGGGGGQPKPKPKKKGAVRW